jgi:gluconolactonase
MRAMVAMTSGNPDGMAIDSVGNLFVATKAGIEVFAPSGTKWGTIAVPMQPTNCAFGDADHQTLYITAQTSVYKVRLAHPGEPRR